ncbi:MAG: hypothetical protein KY455_12905 [Euryarchaeota archaeon]|nr:hypothetical protein [Euryarchaeota archaeon]
MSCMRKLFLVPLALLLTASAFGPATQADDLPAFVPEAALGFAIEPIAALAAPTAIAFGPDLGTSRLPHVPSLGPDLYATLVSGQVVRIDLAWHATGPVVEGVSVIATGFSLPLGLVFANNDSAMPAGALHPPLFVADSHPGDESLRRDGRVTRLDFTDTDGDGKLEEQRRVVVDGLPNGRHNANHMRIGSDGLLYLANGNPNDNGRDGGAADVHPYSGAILLFDAEMVTLSPTEMRWRDDNGTMIPPDELATHPVNADFVSKVESYAHGFRNIFGVAEHDGHWYTATNGADDPSSQDTLYRVTPGADHGFPACYDVGPAGGVGDAISKVPNPIFPDTDCSTQPVATALLGWHTCTTGLDFPTAGPWSFPAAMHDSVFVAECAVFFANDWLVESLADPANASHNTSHKVVRVALDEEGNATEVQDFVTGLALPTDVLFGPDGSMFIADAGGVLRVAPIVGGL